MSNVYILDQRSNENNLFNGFAKLWHGFCDPSNIDSEPVDSKSEDLHKETRSLSSATPSQASAPRYIMKKEDNGVDGSFLELKATNSGRQKRISRGLSVGGVGILSVLLTLWILMHMEEKSSDILNFHLHSSQAQTEDSSSKPWIQIQFNPKFTETPSANLESKLKSMSSMDDVDVAQLVMGYHEGYSFHTPTIHTNTTLKHIQVLDDQIEDSLRV